MQVAFNTSAKLLQHEHSVSGRLFLIVSKRERGLVERDREGGGVGFKI